MRTHLKLNHPCNIFVAICVGLVSISLVDVARAEFWFEDFTDGSVSDSGIAWLFSQDHSIEPDGLLLSTDNTNSTAAGPDWPADRHGWSIRTQGHLLQDHGFFGLASMPTPGVDTGEGTWSVLADESALMGIHGQFFGSTDADLRPFAEEVVVQLDTLDSTLRMWAWRAGEQPTEDIAPLMIEADLDVPNGAPAIWTRSNDGSSSALFRWAAFSTEHMPINMLVPISDLRGDIDGDGKVQFSDFLILSDSFGNQVDPPGTHGDLDGNGKVEFPDFLILSDNFARTKGTAAAVPEPSSLLLSLVAVGIGITRRRRAETRLHRDVPSGLSVV